MTSEHSQIRLKASPKSVLAKKFGAFGISISETKYCDLVLSGLPALLCTRRFCREFSEKQMHRIGRGRGVACYENELPVDELIVKPNSIIISSQKRAVESPPCSGC